MAEDGAERLNLKNLQAELERFRISLVGQLIEELRESFPRRVAPSGMLEISASPRPPRASFPPPFPPKGEAQTFPESNDQPPPLPGTSDSHDDEDESVIDHRETLATDITEVDQFLASKGEHNAVHKVLLRKPQRATRKTLYDGENGKSKLSVAPSKLSSTDTVSRVSVTSTQSFTDASLANVQQVARWYSKESVERVTYTLWELLEVFGEVFIIIVIVANAFCFGLQTEYMAQNTTEDIPGSFVIVEVFFCIVFTGELIVRIAKHRSQFLVTEGWMWNLFDAVLVCIALVDVGMEIVANEKNAMGAAKAMKNMAFARILRMLRLLRLLRFARLLKFMGDMNVVIAAIVGSLKSLAGTVTILMLMLYVIGIFFTQIVTSQRVIDTSNGAEGDPALLLWWGSLGRSVLSLFESILGGVDWDDVIKPLIGIDQFWGWVFGTYIMFVLLAMMNVVTGIFVESAIQNAKTMKDKAFTQHVRTFFKAIDSDGSGEITRNELSLCMNDHTIAQYFVELGIEDQDACVLFDYLDEDQSDSINSEELLAGLVRLRAGAKFIDMMTLLHELSDMKVFFAEGITSMRKEMRMTLDQITKRRTTNARDSSRTILTKNARDSARTILTTT